MSPAELSMTDLTPSNRYNGRNMTLPASWWTSISLFQLERRAIFAKVPHFFHVLRRHGYTQLIPLISSTRDPIKR
jgi:hypothetical protein